MDDVARYTGVVDDDGYHNPGVEMELDPNGDFVKYEDYKALSLKLQATEKARDGAATEMIRNAAKIVNLESRLEESGKQFDAALSENRDLRLRLDYEHQRYCGCERDRTEMTRQLNSVQGRLGEISKLAAELVDPCYDEGDLGSLEKIRALSSSGVEKHGPETTATAHIHLTEEEIADKACQQNPTDSVFRHFDHWWNVVISGGLKISGWDGLRDFAKAAFECGVETGEARAKI